MAFKSLIAEKKYYARESLIAVNNIVLFILIIFAMTIPAQAQNKTLSPLVITQGTSEEFLAPHSLLQFDERNQITPESIEQSHGRNLNGKTIAGNMIPLGQRNQTVWIATRILNQSSNSQWMIDVGKSFDGRTGGIETLRAYEISISKETDKSIKVLPIEKIIGNETVIFNLQKNEQKLFLLQIKPIGKTDTYLPLKIHSPESLVSKTKSRSAHNGIVIFSIAVFLFVFGIIGVLKKSTACLVYAVYFGIIGGLYAVLNQVLKMPFTGLQTAIISLSPFFVSFLAIFLSYAHNQKQEENITSRYVYATLILLNTCMVFLFFIIPDNKPHHIYITANAPLITFLFLTIFSFASHIHLGIKKQSFAMGFLLLFASYFVSTLPYFGFYPQEGFVLNAFWYALPIQGILILSEILDSGQTHTTVKKQTTTKDDEPSVFLSGKVREAKDIADHSRLLKVIEKEREALADFREKESVRMKEMERAKEAADEANRAKSAFLAVVSHEIRTPMTGIMGMVKLLIGTSLNKQQHDYALTVQESAEAMMALLNDILDFEKIQRGKIDIENISFDLHRIIHGVINLMSGHAAEKGITLSANMDENVPRFVKGDPTRLRQILLNLMGNGIKFTEKGGVTLYIKNLKNLNEDEIQNGATKYNIYFGVQDTGIGISAEAQKNLFNPFSQANSSIARKFGGSGLGLAISKGLIEKMGSTVNINSNEGEGSTFFFTLKMEKGLAVTQTSTTTTSSVTSASGGSASIPISSTGIQAPIKPLKILLVDDNEITRKVVSGFLEGASHVISHAVSAEDALTQIEANLFDLVFMDIELPGMRGNEAVKKLRQHADPAKSKLPVFAVTGNVDNESLKKYMADGMTGFIGKPIDQDKLKEIVSYVSSSTYEREIKHPVTKSVFDDIQLGDDLEDTFVMPQKAPVLSSHNSGVFNPEMLQSLKDTIGAKSLNELLDDLILKTDEILTDMATAVEQNDFGALAARAHELKGMAGNFGLVEISSIAAQAEKKAKENESDGLSILVSQLPDASLRAKDVLKNWVSH